MQNVRIRKNKKIIVKTLRYIEHTVNSMNKAAINIAISPNTRSSTVARFSHSNANLEIRIRHYQ